MLVFVRPILTSAQPKSYMETGVGTVVYQLSISVDYIASSIYIWCYIILN